MALGLCMDKGCEYTVTVWPFKAAVLQMLKKKKINGKYFSSYVQWRNLLLLTTNSVDKIIGKTLFFLCIIYCVTNVVAVMYSIVRNIPVAD